jgi:phage-related holin
LALLYVLFLIIPKKQIILSYIPYFLSTFSFYLLITLLSPLIQDGVWGTLSMELILFGIIKSLVTTALIFLINKVIDNFRSNEQLIL